ncbi:MAG: hypothetical protein H0W50_00030 [Parachlamydiaceae bacterium]|nr:hypothetical protein [Parachlamydiaceae bacterium]
MSTHGAPSVGGLGEFKNLGEVNISIAKTSLWGPRTVSLSFGDEKQSGTINGLIKNLRQEIIKSVNNPERLAELREFIGKVKVSELKQASFSSNRDIQFEDLEAKINSQLIFNKIMEINEGKYVNQASVSETSWLESRNVTFNIGDTKVKMNFNELYDILDKKIATADPENKDLLKKLERSISRLKNLDESNRNDYGTYRKRDNQIADLKEKLDLKRDAPMVYEKIKSVGNYDSFTSISSENFVLGSRQIEFKSSTLHGKTNFEELINLISKDIKNLEAKIKENNPEKLNNFNKELAGIKRTFERIKDMEVKSRNSLSKSISYENRDEQWQGLTKQINELKL